MALKTARSIMTVVSLLLSDTNKEEKVSKASVKYRDAPNAGKICSACSMWIYPNKCSAVRGVISSNGWCVLFKPKGVQSVQQG